MGGQRQAPTAAASKVDPNQQPYLADIRQQAQKQFQLGTGDLGAGVDAGITAALAPVERKYTEQILPRLTSAAEQAGAYGGSGLQLARGGAGRDFTTEAARIALTLRPQLLAQELQQQWAPLANYANIVGAPTVLSQGGMSAQPSRGAGILSGALGGLGLASSLGAGGLFGAIPEAATGAAAFGGWPVILGGLAAGGLAGGL